MMSTYLDAVYALFVLAYKKNPKRSRFKSSELSNRAVSHDLDEDVMSLLKNLPEYDSINMVNGGVSVITHEVCCVCRC